MLIKCATILASKLGGVEMAKTDTIHMRVSPDIKSAADSILSQLGITTADAINMFLKKGGITNAVDN